MSKVVHLALAFVMGGLTVAVAYALSRQTDRSTTDPVALDPNMYKVVLDNEHLRAIDYHLKPGEKEPVPSHARGVFVYFFTDADTRGTVLNGETSESHRKAGEVLWREPVTHMAENIGHSEIHQLLVEPKESCEKTGTH